MKFRSVVLLAASVSSVAFASEFMSSETACGFGDQNASVAKAYAESNAQAECGGASAPLARRVSDWNLIDFTHSESGHECTKAEATFSCN